MGKNDSGLLILGLLGLGYFMLKRPRSPEAAAYAAMTQEISRLPIQPARAIVTTRAATYLAPTVTAAPIIRAVVGAGLPFAITPVGKKRLIQVWETAELVPKTPMAGYRRAVIL